jgi:ABC-type transport system substrate-binding protein
VPAFGIVTFGTPAGGWASLTEVHTDGLVTGDDNSRTPVGRLAERVPSLDDGSITLQPDGTMRVVFSLRRGVTWHDGTPFTADDMVFSYLLGGPNGIPQYLNGALPFVSSMEATDPNTLAITYKAPYFQADPLYEVAKDDLRGFPYSPDRARALLQEAAGVSAEMAHCDSAAMDGPSRPPSM